MAKRKKIKIDTSKSNDKLGSLEGLFKSAGFEKSLEIPHTQTEKTPEESTNWEILIKSQTNLHISVERKGRKGKTVSIIRGFDVDESTCKTFASLMSKSFGCGSTVEKINQYFQIVIQGDNREKITKWLKKHQN